MIYLEGTDGVGKTATIEKLRNYGIECSDRNKEMISKYMTFSVPMEERVKKYEKYLKTTRDKVIFIVNNNKEEMLKRVLSRSVIDEYDLKTNEFNKLYLDTYYKMKEKGLLYNKLFLADCTNLNIEEQVKKIKNIIDKIKNKE